MPSSPLALAGLIALALWILVSSLDDLAITLIFLFIRRKTFSFPTATALDAAPQRPIAILVPLWREHRVIRQMLEHNLAAIGYSAYEIFVGVYPNDSATLAVVREMAACHPRVHLAIGSHDGPTSKGDCLNSIYRHMRRFEERHAIRFEILLTHDAEDLIHPESLRLINWFSRNYAMVQVPVLALPTPLRELTHGLYCDEFAEYQTKDIPVRQALGGFLPANGVGTGFSRAALDHLASTRGGLIFDPTCLTEDYENGLRLHLLGYRQIFLPVHFHHGHPIATREYFPRNFRAAVRQRSRWVAGITLQAWKHHRWRGGWRRVYWFWRDRKGLLGNLLSPLANLLFLAGLGSRRMAVFPLWLSRLCVVSYSIAFIQLAVRTSCVARIYGWRFSLGAPLRILWGNVVNSIATLAAIRQFAAAELRHRSIAWRKTDHAYPRARLGELLVRLRVLSVGELEEALTHLPKGVRIGQYLLQHHKLSEEILYQALSLQSSLPDAPVTTPEIDPLAIRLLPVETSRHWNVLPFRVNQGVLHIATDDVPSLALTRALSRISRLEIRYRLVRPGRLAELTRQYLPPR